MCNFRLNILVLTSVWSHLLYSQTIENPKISFTDSLKGKSYQELYSSFYYNKDNDTLYDLYAKEFIKKAYREKDTLKISARYYIITTKRKDKYFPFYDSLIKYSKIIAEDEVLWKA